MSVWLTRAATQLAGAHIDEPGREARQLLAHAMGLSRTELLMARERLVPAHAQDLLDRRCRREPLAYILGRQPFWSLDLAVSRATLIPRADSETLVEAALTLFPRRDEALRILDLGTGTGCLLLALLDAFPAAWGLGIDRVPAAAALARRNAADCGLAGRCTLIAGDWAAAIDVGAPGAGFDLVVGNPPYVVHDDIAGLMPEVSRHEPVTALDGGADGLEAYRAVMEDVARTLSEAGTAILEIGAGQEAAVAALAGRAGLARVGCRADQGGIARALILRRAPP